MCRITPHFVVLFVVRTSVLTHILASFLGDDGHLHHHGSLVVELVNQLFPVLLFLQCGVESQPAAVPDELARHPEPVPQAATIARLRQQPILAVQEFCKVFVQPIFSLFSVQNPDICTPTESHDPSTVLDSVGISGSGISVVLH